MRRFPIPRPWLYVSVLLLGLFLLGIVIVLGQGHRDRAEQEQHARDDLALVSELVRNELQLGQYQNAVNLVANWGSHQGYVTAMTLDSSNGYRIAEYARPRPATDTLWLQAELAYGYDGRATLSVGTDRSGLAARQERLSWQLLGVWLALSALLAYLAHLWQRNKETTRTLIAQTRAQERANAELAKQIDERARAEAALIASKAQLEEAQAITHLGSWELDLSSGEASWSNEEIRLLGYEPGAIEPSAEHFMARVHPADREQVQSEMRAAMNRPDGAYGIEHRVLLPGPRERILLERGYVTFDAEGKPQRMLGTSLDVTALRESERRLVEAQRIARIGSWDLDLINNRLLWSDEIYRIFEMHPGQVPESYELFLSMVHPDDRERVNAGYRQSVREHTAFDIVHRLLLPDGRIKYLHEQCETTYDEEDRPIRSLGTCQDVTELKLAEEKLRDYQEHLEALVEERTRRVREQALVIDQIHDAVVTTDMDGTVTSWNAGAERLFGYPVDQAVGRSVRFIYPPQDHDHRAESLLPPLAEKDAHETEARMLRSSGEVFHAHLSLSILYDEQGAPCGMVGYAIDITARKEAEQRLREKSLALQAANRELESFSYSVSHDLRAPLRGIDGFSQALQEDYGDQLPAGARDYLSRVRAGARRMGELIDDMLRLSRVTRTPMEPADVDLSELAASIIEAHTREEPKRQVVAKIAPGLTARADPGLIRILLENLLGNAWKYTAHTESAEIELGAERTDGETRFFVRDNGAGFDMQYSDKLFGAFQRLHHPSEFPGSGIGLATAQRIARRHGGRIWAEGKVGHGAVFRFVLGDSERPESAAT